MTLGRINLPPEAAALYQSGATIKAVAKAFGCSYDGARNSLVRAGVELRHWHVSPPRVTVTIPVRLCRDCGERLDRPHVLGAHLPGCSHAPAIPSSTSDRGEPRW